MTQYSYLILGGFIAVCFLAAMSGAIFRPDAWYDRLTKPSWQPPKWVFAPAWSVLYLTIAVSGWLIWRAEGFLAAATPFAAYGVNLMINASWSGLFFGLHRPDLAFIDVVVLWLSIVVTILLFYPINLFAAYLLVPYLCWVTFAAVLNFTVWQLNPVTKKTTPISVAR